MQRGGTAPTLGAICKVALLLFFPLVLLLSSGARAQPSADEVRDGRSCANCHADAAVIWAGKHGTKADSRAPVSVGCAMCHGDPSEHVKSPGNPMPQRFSKMASADKNAVCNTCHQGATRIHWPGSAHERN